MTRANTEKTYFWATVAVNGFFYLLPILFFTTNILGILNPLKFLGPFSVLIVGLGLPLLLIITILYFAIRGFFFLKGVEEKKLVVAGLTINLITIAIFSVYILLFITGLGSSRG